MKRGLQDTIYQLGPILLFNVVLLSLFTPLVDTIKNFNSKFIAYSICANKMIDYAFLGKVYNFSQCYENLSTKNLQTHCILYGSKVICLYNNKTYAYELFIEKPTMR